MKQKTKHFCAIALLCILSLLLTQKNISTFVCAANEDATPTDANQCIQGEESSPMLGDLSGEQFYVSPTGAYVKDVLSGDGSYFSEIHSLFTCTGEDANRIAAYCLNPARTAPKTTTSYREYPNSNQTDFMTENKSGASAVLMYGYGGESSINNDTLGLANPNENIGGSYGIYVIDGMAQFGLLINGCFYHLDPLEAQAVTAAAIHKLNGSDISEITDTSGGNVSSANAAFDTLYQLGSWTQRHIEEYGYEATERILSANTKGFRSIDITVMDKNKKPLALPADYTEKNFDWSPYILNGQITFEVTYKASHCESKLLSSRQKGTTNHLSFIHDSVTEFPGVESANGYYDYFEIKEADANTIPISVTYHPLRTEEIKTPLLGAVDADGSFQVRTGQLFTQNATITISASDLDDGKVLDLIITSPEGVTFTPFYGDGDKIDGSYNAGRFFYAHGYQDMVICSPYNRLASLSKSLRIQAEPPKTASFQIMKYSKRSVGAETVLQGAGFMACNIQDLKKTDGIYQFDKQKAIPLCSDGSTELFTDANGYACSIPLPIGKYLIKETTVPSNHYAVDDFIITISNDSPSLLPVVKCVDNAFEVTIHLYKIDAYSRNPIKNNPATFRIWSYDNDSYVNFSATETECFNIQTDSDGFCQTPIPLAAGKYRIDEVSAPVGYYCSSESSIEFEVDENIPYDTFSDTSIGYSYIIENTPIYGAVWLHKTGEKRVWNETTGAYVTSEIALSGIVFDIIAAEDIYSSDGNGCLLYEKNTLVASLTTDDSGNASTTIDLPLGTYILHEHTPDNYIKCEDMTFSISSGDVAIEQCIGTTISKKIIKSFNIHNKIKEPTIETSAINVTSNSKTGKPTKQDIISDAIYYKNLVEGNTYEIQGVIMDKETNEPLLVDGSPVTAKSTFVCESTDGEITLDFQFDSSLLAGSELVLYERLYYDGEIICLHEDINNSNQTIIYETPPIEKPPLNTPPVTTPPLSSPPEAEPPVVTTPPNVPKTGDSTPIYPFIILCVCALFSFFILLFKNQIYRFLKKITKK